MTLYNFALKQFSALIFAAGIYLSEHYLQCKYGCNRSLHFGAVGVQRTFPVQCKIGRSGGAMVLGKLPVLGRPTIWIIVGQGPIALAIGAGGGCLDNSPLSFLKICLWETARYRLKYF